MDYLSRNVGRNVKRIRRQKGLSLERASEQTGVSKSMLAEIEKEHANPSLGVLGKIASGLQIEFHELFEMPPMDACLVKVEGDVPTKEILGNYRVWTCFPFEENKLTEVYRIDVEPGGSYVSGGHGEKSQEYIAVLDGEITIVCSGGKHKVTKDDVFSFRTDQEHRYINNGEELARIVCFFVANG